MLLRLLLDIGLFSRKLIRCAVIDFMMFFCSLISSCLHAGYETSINANDLLEKITSLTEYDRCFVKELDKDLIPEEIRNNRVLVIIDKNIAEVELALFYYMKDMLNNHESIRNIANDEFLTSSIIENNLDDLLLKINSSSVNMSCVEVKSDFNYQIVCECSLESPSNIKITILRIEYPDKDLQEEIAELESYEKKVKISKDNCFCDVYETNLEHVKMNLDKYIESNDMYPTLGLQTFDIVLLSDNDISINEGISNSLSVGDCISNAPNIIDKESNKKENKEYDRTSYQNMTIKDRKVTRNILYCIQCNETFYNKDTLKNHNIEVHTGEITPQCSVCGGVFSDKKELRKHVKHFCKPSKYVCTICKYNYSSRSSLNAHMRFHNMNKIFKCDKCNKQYTREDRLVNHYRTHTNSKPFSCKECNKFYLHKCSLKKHNAHVHFLFTDNDLDIDKNMSNNIINKKSNNESECSACGGTFSREAELKKHLKYSCKDRKYVCPICNKGYNKINSFNMHIYYHTYLRPYQCGKCKKQFKMKNHLESHYNKVHAHETSMLCKEPGKSFKYKESSRAHKCHMSSLLTDNDSNVDKGISNSVGSNTINCTWCEEVFYDKDTFENHMEVHEGKILPGSVFSNDSELRKHNRNMYDFGKHVCPICYHGNDSKKDLIEHMYNHQQFPR